MSAPACATTEDASLDEVVRLMERHRIKPLVSAVFPLAQAGEALALMERGGQFGKIVVRF